MRGEIPGVTFHNARATGPLHGRDGVLADLQGVGVRKDIGVLTHACVIALGLGVAVEDGRQLLAGDVVLRPEQAAAVAAHNALRRRPGHGVLIPCTLRHIGEGQFHRLMAVGVDDDGIVGGVGEGEAGRTVSGNLAGGLELQHPGAGVIVIEVGPVPGVGLAQGSLKVIVNPNSPSCLREIWMVSTAPVMVLTTLTGMVEVFMDTPMSRSVRSASAGISCPFTVHMTPPGSLISRVTSLPDNFSNTSLFSLVLPVVRLTVTVSPALAASILSVACWLGVLVGVVEPEEILVNPAVTVTSPAGMVKVVLSLDTSAKVPPWEDVQPVKR